MVLCDGCGKTTLSDADAEVVKEETNSTKVMCATCMVKDTGSTGSFLYARQRYVVNYLLAHPCNRCLNDNIVVLTFHHVDKKTKVSDVSKLVASGPMRELKEEITKCVVLCWNCHHLLHEQEHPGYKLKHKRAIMVETHEEN